jgi:alkanesulfonate monooxygenase SsuD/methylene tetrahydromethanopterin reductase-like flavin-dependent oxidoreductase (luciferase family)
MSFCMKKIGFLSFGHWTPSHHSQTQSAADVLLQSIDLAVEAERLGMDGAYFRVHHSLDNWHHRSRAEEFLELLRGKGFAQPNPRPMFANPPGLLRLEPYSDGLRDRIWWGSASNATAIWAAKHGMNLQSSTLKFDESGEPPVGPKLIADLRGMDYSKLTG